MRTRRIHGSLGLACWLTLPAMAFGADAALVVGMGAISFAEEADAAVSGEEHPRWRRIECPDARTDAERAFRELVRAAAGGPLYDVSPLWYDRGRDGFNPAILLTDGVTDNRAVPSVPVLKTMSARAWGELEPGDDGVAFFAGPGDVSGSAPWISGRRGGKYALRDAADALFGDRGDGLRVMLARIYPVSGTGPPTTIYVADPDSVARLRAWCADGVREVLDGRPVDFPGRLFPGLAGDLAAAAPTRLMRCRDVMDRAEATTDGPVTIVFNREADSMRQVVEVPVELSEETLYRTNRVRRAGPLFTIIEDEIIEPVGTTTTIDADRLARDLAARMIPGPSAAELAGLVRDGAGESFTLSYRLFNMDYELAFSREQSRVKVAYDD